jgi:hypothetical protein
MVSTIIWYSLTTIELIPTGSEVDEALNLCGVAVQTASPSTLTRTAIGMWEFRVRHSQMLIITLTNLQIDKRKSLQIYNHYIYASSGLQIL